MKKAYEFQYKDTTITMFADTKKEALAIFADEYRMSVKQAGKLFIPAIKPVEQPKQEETKQETAQEQQEQEQQEAPQEETKQEEPLISIDGDTATVTFFIRSQKEDESGEIHGTVTAGTRKISLPKAFTGNGEEVERFIITDTFAQIDADKNRANRVLSSETATEEAQEEAKEALRILDEQHKILSEIRTNAGYTADAPTVADFPLSRILACVVTRTALPAEYGTAKKALKSACAVYDAITDGTGRAMTAQEQETVTGVKTALVDILKPFTVQAKDSKGFNIRIKNEDVRDLYKISWKMEEDGRLTCIADKKRGTLERNLFKVAFGKVLHLEETENK